uniref:Uncharacterized protein n=1 Tax=Setaria viridis TaxID=4556 RepID=A0A4U6VQL1_SETVI|nr:hypothetical protein SEVIR_2G146200v2 [Setaria viridis]
MASPANQLAASGSLVPSGHASCHRWPCLAPPLRPGPIKSVNARLRSPPLTRTVVSPRKLCRSSAQPHSPWRPQFCTTPPLNAASASFAAATRSLPHPPLAVGSLAGTDMPEDPPPPPMFSSPLLFAVHTPSPPPKPAPSLP